MEYLLDEWPAKGRGLPIHGQHANMPICSNSNNNKKTADESDWRPDYRRTRKSDTGQEQFGA